VRRSSTSPDT